MTDTFLEMIFLTVGENLKSQRFTSVSSGEAADGKIELTFRRWFVENQCLVLGTTYGNH